MPLKLSTNWNIKVQAPLLIEGSFDFPTKCHNGEGIAHFFHHFALPLFQELKRHKRQGEQERA